MDYEVIDNKIFYFKNAIPNHEKIIDFISKNNNAFISEWLPWKELEHRGGRDYGFVKKINSLKIYDSEAAEYVKEILSGINSACKIYAREQNIMHNRSWKDFFTILKYHEIEIQPLGEMPGGVLPAHLDHPDPDNLTEHTILVYYNDDYLGGDLVFDTLNKTIKPEAGSIIMFQSVDPITLHSTLPIVKGTKCFTFQLWVDGPGKGWNDAEDNKYYPFLLNY